MPTVQQRFLIVDDDPGDIELLERQLEEIIENQYKVHSFTSVESVLSELDSLIFDLVFIDYYLGEKNGLEVFQEIRDHGCECPVVLLTGQGSEQLAVDAMKAGISDYIIKGSMDTYSLKRVVDNAIVKHKLEQEVKDHQRRLEEKVVELQEALDQVKRLHGILPICMHCKKIRDDMGSWDQLEHYISNHSDADFSHGICPDCKIKYYSEYS